MRFLLLVLMLVASAATLDAAPIRVERPRTTSILVYPFLRAWQPRAVAATRGAGMTLPPETGADPTPVGAARTADAHRNPLDGVQIRSRADGSRFAVLGGLGRVYLIATVGPEGRLIQNCVRSRQEALEEISGKATQAQSTRAPEPTARSVHAGHDDDTPCEER